MLEKFVVSAVTAHDWVSGYAVKGDAVLGGDELVAFLRGVTSPAALSEVGGSFAAVLPMSDRLRVVTDRMGSRPVFYAKAETGWLVGSEFWALASRLGPLKPSAEAAVQLVAFKYVLGTETMSDRILEAPPGSWLDLFHDGRVETERYWRYRPEPRERSGKKLVSELAEVIDGMAERSIRAGTLMGLDHWGVNLTAGRDSRVILASLVRAGERVSAWSSDLGDDARVASKLAGAVGIQHRTVPFWDSLGSPWVPDVMDPLVPTTMAAVAGHPVSLSLAQCSDCPGWLSGHLGNLVGYGLRYASRENVQTFRKRVAKNGRINTAGDLTQILRARWGELVIIPDQRIDKIIQSTDVSSEALVQQVFLEQRERRFILRDYTALRVLGPSVLWFADPAWADFWATVPRRWLVGSPLYTRVLNEKVLVGDLAPLGRIPVNGQPLSTVRHPRLRDARRELKRKLVKRVNRVAVPPPQSHAVGLTSREIELASWLIEPDYFRTDRPRALVESVRSIARATELMGG